MLNALMLWGCGKAGRRVGACGEVGERWVPVGPYKEH